MERLRNELIGKAEAFIGRPIRYSSMGPSLFGTLDIRNIQVLSAPGSAAGGAADNQSLLRISRFRLSYSLPALVKGKPDFIRSIKIDKPVVNFDTARDGDILGLFSAGNTDAGTFLKDLAELLPKHALLNVRRGQFSVYDKKNLYRVRKFGVDLSVEDKQILLDGRWSTDLSLNFASLPPLNAGINMRVKGNCSTSLDEGSAVIKIPSVTGNVFGMKTQTFSFVMEKEFLRLRKIDDQIPLDFSFAYGLKTGSVEAFLNCDGFVLGNMITLSGPRKRGRTALSFISGGSASFVRKAGGALRYNIDLAGRTPPAASGSKKNGGSLQSP
ncbi:MAG: hypothetical protein LBJ90_07880, partial [Treponema sp.]|nr:hypothetical protein [Treponema sp.]